MQQPLFGVNSNWRKPDLAKLPSWRDSKYVSIDTETCDPKLKKTGIGVRSLGYMVGVSFCLDDGVPYYLPIRHLSYEDNLPEINVLRYLKKQAAEFTGEVVGMNLPYDLDYLAWEGVEFNNCAYFRDIAIADPLVYELHQSYSLQSIAERWGFKGKDEQMLQDAANAYKVDSKSGLWQLPARFVGEYAEEDARLPLMIYRKQMKYIESNRLQPIFDLESKLLPVLLKMRQRGVRIDEAQLENVEKKCYNESIEQLAFVKEQTGVTIDISDLNMKGKIGAALEKIGATFQRTEKSGAIKIDSEFLESLQHPVAKAIKDAKIANKMRTSFVQSVREHVVNGRIHCTFRQLVGAISSNDDSDGSGGVRFGRLSCSNPNLQQQPSKGKWGKEWRKVYLPDEGKKWASIDYSQQEPRWTVHYASMLSKSGKKAADAYKENPKMDNYAYVAEIANIDRSTAKTVVLAQVYGQGKDSLCAKLGIDQYSADQIISTINQKLPYIETLKAELLRVLNDRGYIKTILGRQLHTQNKHAVINALVQGSSADQMKAALVEIDKQGYPLQLSIHDEICLSVDKKEEAEHIAEICSTVVKSHVPFPLDVELGDSWGDSMS
jgi:DNA polymerase I-like protein with 3'-5' exonuclease and polymerase domains